MADSDDTGKRDEPVGAPKKTFKPKPTKADKARKAKAKKKAESEVDKYVRANKNHPDNKRSGQPNQIVQPPSKEAIEDLKVREQSAQETAYTTPDWRDLPPAPAPGTVAVVKKD